MCRNPGHPYSKCVGADVCDNAVIARGICGRRLCTPWYSPWKEKVYHEGDLTSTADRVTHLIKLEGSSVPTFYLVVWMLGPLGGDPEDLKRAFLL